MKNCKIKLSVSDRHLIYISRCNNPPNLEFQQNVGKHLTSSLFFGIPISLSHIGNWLLMVDGENVDSPPSVFL